MSVEYVSGVCRSICRPILDRHLGRLSRKISTDTWSSFGRDGGRVCRLRCRPSLDRHTDQVSTDIGDWRSTYLKRISTEARPSVGRYLAQVSAEMSVEYRLSGSRDVGGVCGWSMWVEYVGGVCRSISRLILDHPSTDSVGRYLTDSRRTLSADISADTWPISRPILDRHSTDSIGW